MLKLLPGLVFIFLSISLTAQHNLHLSIHSLPASTSKTDIIYIAGTFNNWNPKDENYKFTRDSYGNYSVDLPVKQKTGEYKLTRGGWDKVETDKDCNAIGNRQYNVDANDLLGIIVSGWADHFAPKQRISTASKNVNVIDTPFYIPQLKRRRTVRIYLPGDYTISKKRYPVLYMHDGQNLFDELTGFAGEWGVDETLDSLGKL